jgi:hypothetical protein
VSKLLNGVTMFVLGAYMLLVQYIGPELMAAIVLVTGSLLVISGTYYTLVALLNLMRARDAHGHTSESHQK